jgi:hypothetical protein
VCSGNGALEFFPDEAAMNKKWRTVA